VIEGDELVIKDDDFRTVRRVPQSNGISGAVAVGGEPCVLDNALADERYDQQVDCVPGLQTRSMVVVPVKAATGRLGTIALLQAVNKLDTYEEPYSVSRIARFDENDVALLTHIARLITSAHQQAQLESRHLLELSRSKALLDVAQEISAQGNEMKQVMQVVRKRCNKLFDCERCTLFVVDEDGNSLSGLSVEDDATETRFPVRTGLTGRVALHGDKINLKGDAYQDPVFKPEIDWQAGYRVRSFLCMPLVKRIDGHSGKAVCVC
jgi:adenylate cyclase